jgi:IclR family acetate operon transcriptional repressor
VLLIRKLRLVLDQFAPEAPALTLRQIEVGTGLPHGTCARLVQNLVAEGFLERTGTTYRVGLHLLHWGAAATAGLDLPTKAQPVLEWLRDTTGEAATLYVRQGTVRVCLAVAQSRKEVVVRQIAPGRVMPLGAGSAGRVLLAFGADTPQNDPAAVARLRHVRRDGYSLSLAETDPGVSSISAPVLDARGEVAALSIVAPTDRVTGEGVEVRIAAVRAAAERLSHELGGLAYERSRKAPPKRQETAVRA